MEVHFLYEGSKRKILDGKTFEDALRLRPAKGPYKT
jgi:hypothetical protein